jgi:hypothetical protein
MTPPPSPSVVQGRWIGGLAQEIASSPAKDRTRERDRDPLHADLLGSPGTLFRGARLPDLGSKHQRRSRPDRLESDRRRLEDSAKEFADFMTYFNSNLAREAGRLVQ